jgi:hypothetical protein
MLEKYILQFNTEADYKTAKRNNLVVPSISYIASTGETHIDNAPLPIDTYLTFIAKGDGEFNFGAVRESAMLEYSTDNGQTWTEGNSVKVGFGDKVMWKGPITATTSGIGTFYSTVEFDVEGNIMSLLSGDNFRNNTTIRSGCFASLFAGAPIVNADNLILAATTLETNCYEYMFGGCKSLIMAPELPATTLADNCYELMFSGCTLLTTAPELPALELVSDCYNSMFAGCTNLNYINANFITTPGNDYTYDWVKNVSPTGTFVKNTSATWNVRGNNGVPSGWVIGGDGSDAA